MNAHPRPYYYLENFATALEWLRARYRDLLADDERRFMATFAELPVSSAALLVRMVMRQGDLFRTSKLRYSEIGCPVRAAAPLVAAGWLDPEPAVSGADLSRLLRKTELSDVFRVQGSARTLRKSEIVPPDVADETRRLREWWPAAPDEIFQVMIAPLCERLRLMFFGNFRQTWSEFVLADLGIFRYEQVPLEESARAFQTREQVTHFEALYRCRELLDDEAELDDVRNALPAPLSDTQDSWLDAKRAKLLFAIGQRYEKAGELPQALALYQGCKHAEARIRAIRVLEKSSRPQAAASLLAQLQAAPANELEIQLGERIRRRLERRTSHGIRSGWDTIDLQLPRSEVRVELAVRNHLHSETAPVLYVENTLINSLFGLLCWSAIFAPVPGAFFHAFQAAPADLLDTGFRARRARQFTACLDQLGTGAYRDTILDTFERKAGIASAFVSWELPRHAIEWALDCIPAAHLRECFERLLSDIRGNRSGLPDLIQMWPRERRYRLIEVKGPGDRLQDNQLRWLHFCQGRAIPVSVCKVTWHEARA